LQPANEVLDSGPNSGLHQNQISNRYFMMRINIAGKRCERSAWHAYDDGRHVLERVRH
jgi:hypothetical protein